MAKNKKKITTKKTASAKRGVTNSGRRGPVKIECVKTSCKCKCNGKNGYMYNCPELGLVCLPSDAPQMKVTLAGFIGSCKGSNCDDPEGQEFHVIMNNQHAIGSVRKRCLDTGCTDAACGHAHDVSATKVPGMLCSKTPYTCNHNGKSGYFWDCSGKLVCVTGNPSGIGTVQYGKKIQITATSVTYNWTDANGVEQTSDGYSLCDCEESDPIGVIFNNGGQREMCDPTTRACRCRGKKGLIYKCGNLGEVCIPTEDPKNPAKVITKLADLPTKCIPGPQQCDAAGNPEAIYLLDGRNQVIGSQRKAPTPRPQAPTPRPETNQVKKKAKKKK